MKKLLVAALLCAAPLSAGVGKIDTEAVKALLRSRAEVVVLDARSAQYDDGKRIGNAKNITADASANQLAGLIPSKDTIVITYCASETCPASGKLAHKLERLGYVSVMEYPQGLRGWVGADNRLNDDKSYRPQKTKSKGFFNFWR